MSKPLPSSVVLALQHVDYRLDMRGGACAVDEQHKEAMRLYLDTWVRPIVQELIDYALGNLDLRDTTLSLHYAVQAQTNRLIAAWKTTETPQ